ncbi:MAG TPA: glycoside hydrolase domain-containing protein [Planctomycetota bacterium]|nr:glycoside hydrolase domain-containing protein [Planctomycetota bacterium]
MRFPALTLLALGLAVGAAEAATAPWRHELSYSGGGVWRCRVPVTVRNDSGADVSGRPADVKVGTGAGDLPLVGQAIAALRVCDDQGRELLYDLIGADGLPKRTGALAIGDRLVFGVECKSGGTATCYVYADDPQAWLVADWLGAAAPFANGGFEEGADAPARWEQAEADDQHRLAWAADSPHGGKRCVRCDVDPAAPPTWVKWVQTDIGVVPDADYRLEAWVKGGDVKGEAGWFIHVHGQKPMVLNQVAKAGEGTFDWRRVETAFRTPPDAVRATVGTVLRGTGTAWFDDASLTLLGKATALRAECGPAERFALAAAPVPDAWRDRSSAHRVALTVRNLGDAPARLLAAADVVPITRRVPAVMRDAALRVVDPASGDTVPSARLGDQLVLPTEVPPQTERTFHVYFHRPSWFGRLLGRRVPMLDFPDLIASKANLAANPGFEEGEPLPSGWILSAESDEAAAKLYRAARDPEAHSGRWCARIEIPPDAPLKWSGWHTAEIPVKPLTTYLYAAWLRCRDVDSSVQIHGHFHNADGKLCDRVKYFGAGPALKGTQGWTLLHALIQAPADCASVALHLTMNAHGTVWHDDAFFGEAVEAIVGAAEPRRGPADRSDLAAWLVNPVVKVFPDDLPANAPKRIEVAAARNECEPFQLCLRAARDLAKVAVTVDPPRNREGRELDVSLNLVGFVPVDHPSSYYRADVPAWHRKLPPRGSSGCDGWAGLWPDPLPPLTPFDLQANTTQPIWATVSVPADAPPGTYHGALAIQSSNHPSIQLPLRVTVWDFALPKASRLKVIYDFRDGFTRQFGGASGTRDEVLRKWYAFLAERRISPGILPSPTFGYKDGQVTMDTAEFDRAASYCLDELGVNCLYTPWFFYSFGWAHKPRKLFGFEPFTKEYAGAYAKCLKAYMDHLRAKGWADKVTLYISDEPHFRREGVVEQMKQAIEIIKGVEPNLPIYSSTWDHVPEWDGHLTCWGVGPHGSFPVAKMRERLAAGDTLWFTTDGHMCLDTPYCAIERLLPWLCWKYGVAAYEFWGVNWWTYDPWERGWHTFISQSDDGARYYYVRYPNGDGYLTYPGKRVGVDGPVSSIRLEQAREGIEDYEYFRLLDELIAKARERGVGTREAERVRAEAAALVAIPNRGGRYSTSLLPDPDAVPRLRAEVARAIESLARKLR